MDTPQTKKPEARTERVVVLVSQDERRAIEEAATKEDRPLSSWMRQAALQALWKAS